MEYIGNGNNKSILIGIIDSGIKTDISDLDKFVVKSTGYRVNENGFIVEDENIEVKAEHGTAIALIVRHLCKNVHFISINILNERLATDGRLLIYAIEKILSYKPDVIHLSLGTTKWIYKFKLYSLIEYAYKNNILVVSASNNQKKISYPAALKDVIGVKSIKTNNVNEFHFYKGYFFAPYGVIGIEDIDQLTHQNITGNSMAAAYITGHIANIKSCNRSADNREIIKELKKCQNVYG